MATRNYKREYAIYHSKPEQRKRRSKRTVARRQAVKEGMVKKGSSKELHHKDNNPMNNSKKNLSIVPRKKNRAHGRSTGRGNKRYV